MSTFWRSAKFVRHLISLTRKNFFILCLALMTGVLSADVPSRTTFQSSEPTTLLELYTSEGCSSCPPAEEWFSSLRSSPLLWKSFVPIAFHVDYWDYLGWKDPTSSPFYTQRQRWYAQAWDANSIYTPGFVLDGKEWRGWGAGQIPPRSVRNVGVLKVTIEKEDLVHVEYTPSINRHHWTAHVALLGMNMESNVLRGENKGRTLHHDFAVLSLLENKMAVQEKGYSAQFHLKRPSTGMVPSYAVAVWVTEGEDDMVPVQAAGGLIP
jgi:hypothetical protein